MKDASELAERTERELEEAKKPLEIPSEIKGTKPDEVKEVKPSKIEDVEQAETVPIQKLNQELPDKEQADAKDSSFPYPEQYAYNNKQEENKKDNAESFPYPEQYAFQPSGEGVPPEAHDEEDGAFDSESPEYDEDPELAEAIKVPHEPESPTVQGMLGTILAKLPSIFTNLIWSPLKSHPEGMCTIALLSRLRPRSCFV